MRKAWKTLEKAYLAPEGLKSLPAWAGDAVRSDKPRMGRQAVGIRCVAPAGAGYVANACFHALTDVATSLAALRAQRPTPGNFFG